MKSGFGGIVLAAFVDESERNENYYFLGALVCTRDQECQIEDALDGVILKHSQTHPAIRPDTELHAYELMAGRGSWKNIPLRLRFGIYHEALRAIDAVGACMHIEGIDVGAQAARGYPTLTPARELAFSHLFERVNDCAGRKAKQVQIFADEHHTEGISRSNFTRYQAWGTYGYKSSKLVNIHQSFDFIDSKTSRALQASDLITYLYNRRKTVKEQDARAEDEKTLLWADIRRTVNRGGSRIWP
ncbi:DUF3800 domain-containing protein [Pseudarthrobacter sulfonivorans]|uniref:DUF3800 domain-containing protein n=1 Tax=Pseudarthrobacter sulfonivorans TaxID=121292 RepID=UPI00285E8928|nr:DUF3800 domain-containing protein [Pseudarthrobacter sulfonivorans]MDR6417582.1 hypothetical protein [Pseudarthrobacter sulfonivorans]